MSSMEPMMEQPRSEHQPCENVPNVRLTELPIKVLTRTFALLELHDRKNVRCTSKRLRKACNSHFITRNEKFFLHSQNTHSLDRFMLKCDTVRTHCEFHGLEVGEKFLEPVWLERGGQFLSLYFHNCRVDGNVFKNIITHCQNLTSLNFTRFHPDGYWKELYEDYENADFLSEPVIDELLEQKIERRNLVSFEFSGHKVDPVAINRIWNKIFIVYPCLHTFKERLLDSTGRSFSDNVENGYYPFEEWVLPPNVHHLASNRCMTANWQMPQSKFNELSIAISVFYLLNQPNCDELLNFFSNQTELKALKLHLWYDYIKDGKIDYNLVDNVDWDLVSTRFSELLGVLKQLPKLENLEIVTDQERPEFYSTEVPVQFGNFLRSCTHLVSLTWANVIFELPNKFGTLEPSVNLKKLRLMGLFKHSEEDEQLLVLKILRLCNENTLQHLELFQPNIGSERILQKLSTLTSLRTLKVDLSKSFIITLANPESTSLRHLSIKGLNLEIVQNIPESFVLPAHLTCLCICVDPRIPSEEGTLERLVDVISMNLPRLEILKIESDQPYYRDRGSHHPVDLVMHCKRLTKLRFLRIYWLDAWKFGLGFKELIEKLFIECPLLRLIDYKDYMKDGFDNIPYTYCRSSGRPIPLSAENAASFWRIVKHTPPHHVT